MHPFVRILALALLTAAFLLPAHGAAQSNPCFATSPSGTIGDTRTVISGNATYASANAGIHSARLHLRLTIAADGTAEAQGAIRLLIDSSSGRSPADATSPYTPVIALAKNVVGLTCADVDGDGIAGLEEAAVDGSPHIPAGPPNLPAQTYPILGPARRHRRQWDLCRRGHDRDEESGSGEVRVRVSQDRSRR